MTRGDVPTASRFLAVLALIILAAGTVTVGSLWITPLSYGQADAAGYGAGLFWPVTVVCACAVGSLALVTAKRQKRLILLLNACGAMLIIGAYAITFGTNILIFTPLRGSAEAVLVVILVGINGSAIVCVQKYFF